MHIQTIKDKLKSDIGAGVLLISAACIAMIIANTPLSKFYDLIIQLPVSLSLGEFSINKPLLLWINDGLMAVFFFMVGLELKRELLEGDLAKPGAITLPLVGAIGGMIVPALVYASLNLGDKGQMHGWAIPAATDIAFALGLLSILGKRVPSSLKVFLVSLAIFDDIGAIIIIALFYSGNLSTEALTIAAVCLVILFTLNRLHVSIIGLYLFIGIIMWVAVLKSGVHATLAGVALALFIPMRDKDQPNKSPVKHLEHELHYTVNLLILPIFAFANSGIRLTGISMDQVLHPVPVGIALGLFLGKQIGIFSFCWLVLKLKLAKLPNHVSLSALYGAAILCGVGFTMSLFIGSLAFETDGVNLFDERLGIIVGSLASGIIGLLWLNKALPKKVGQL